MIISRKIRLLPTKEQEVLFWKSAGTARWAYNFFLSENENAYAKYLENGMTGPKYISECDVRKHINNDLKPTTYTWLKEVGSNVMKMGVKDADVALRNFLKGNKGKPRYKSKHKDAPSFYVNYESLTKTQNGFHGEKIGKVKTSEPLPKLYNGEKYCSPRITYDGKYWYLSVGHEVKEEVNTLERESLGIDLGVKDLAICSSGVKYKNINKTHTVKNTEKRLKREQRKLSRMYEDNILKYDSKRRPIWNRPLNECKNIQKQKAKVKLIYRRLNGIRNNYIHQTTSEIVKTKPSRIVMEDLNIKGMMKNKHLSKAIGDEKLYEFTRQIQYKAKLHGIEFVKADRFYPSSKKCSCCGHIKKDLKLSDRTYICPVCGVVIGRDYNASVNLANYKSA